MQGAHNNTDHFSSPFIGREAEIGLFCELAQKISTDGRYLLLISGRPGVGKSRLLEELYTRAQVLTIGGVKPFLGRYRFREETSLPEDAVWERIFADFRTGKSDKNDIDHIRRLCRNKPAILFIDNLHFGGEQFFIRFNDLLEELGDFHFLAVCAYQELPVYRGRFLSFLSDIKPLSRVIEHRLENLSEQETSLLIEKIIGEAPTRWLLRKIVEQTGGNPLFIQEIGRLIVQYRREYEDDFTRIWEYEVPKAAHKAVARRLASLSQASLRQLQVLSLAGENFTEDEIDIICADNGRDEWRSRLQEGIDYGLIHTDGTSRKYRFSHHIVRTAVTASIPETEIGVIAREGAVKLEAAGLGEREEWALRLAELWRRVPAREAELLYDYAEAKSYAGFRSEAVEYLVKVFRYRKKQYDITGMVQISLRGYFIRAGEPGYVDYFREILDMLPGNSYDRRRVLYRYAMSLFSSIGDFDKVEAILEEADSIHGGKEEPELQRLSLVLHSTLDYISKRYEAAEQKARSTGDKCTSIDPINEINARGLLFISLPPQGKFQEALRQIPDFVHAVSKVRDRYHLVFVYHHLGRFKASAGEWNEARNYFETGADFYPYLPELLAGRSSIEYMLGKIERGDMYRRRLLRLRERTPEGPYKPFIYTAYTAAVRALCTGEEGDVSRWIPVLHKITKYDHVHPFIMVRTHLCLLLSGIILQNIRLIKNIVPVLEKPSRYYLIRPYKIQWALGLGKLQLRKLKEAISHFDKALRSARWFGDKPMEACLLYDLGRVLFLANDSREERTEAAALLQESRETACRLEMEPLAKRISEFLKKSGIEQRRGCCSPQTGGFTCQKYSLNRRASRYCRPAGRSRSGGCIPDIKKDRTSVSEARPPFKLHDPAI